MNAQPKILKTWEGRGWYVQWVDDAFGTPLRVNTASAAPNGTQAMRRQDARALGEALVDAVQAVEAGRLDA